MARLTEPTRHPTAEQVRAYAHHVGEPDNEMETHLDECEACSTLLTIEVLGLPAKKDEGQGG